jgi:uncharacterized protein with PIN domain
VRFLIDECLPARMAELLRAAGHDCTHVYELGLGGQPDEQIMATADRENRILVSADTDFGELLANASWRRASSCSGVPTSKPDPSPQSFLRISSKSPMISPQVLSS